MAYNGPNAVAFAQRQSGRYGDGECWTLMEDAVVGAGGRSSRGQTPHFSPTASYVWGTVVAAGSLQAVPPVSPADEQLTSAIKRARKVRGCTAQ